MPLLCTFSLLIVCVLFCNYSLIDIQLKFLRVSFSKHDLDSRDQEKFRHYAY